MYIRSVILLLISISLLSNGNASACPMDTPLVSDEDIQHPPKHPIAFKAVITKISSHNDLDRGKPHSGFQLGLKITKVFQGYNLKDTIVINYGGCHNLPGKKGDTINVLGLFDKNKGWYAPQFWVRSDDSRNK